MCVSGVCACVCLLHGLCLIHMASVDWPCDHPGRSFGSAFAGERHSGVITPRGLVVVGGVDFPLQPEAATYLASEHCGGVRIVQVGGCRCDVAGDAVLFGRDQAGGTCVAQVPMV